MVLNTMPTRYVSDFTYDLYLHVYCSIWGSDHDLLCIYAKGWMRCMCDCDWVSLWWWHFWKSKNQRRKIKHICESIKSIIILTESRSLFFFSLFRLICLLALVCVLMESWLLEVIGLKLSMLFGKMWSMKNGRVSSQHILS